MRPNPNIFISAGEASGERYGTLLIQSVHSARPGARFFGLGGQTMETAGCERIVRAEDIAIMGITEVVRHMPRVYREYRRLVRSLRAHKPDVAVLIDFPDVNFRLARVCRDLGIPVIYFVSPQLWAWKQHRIRWVRERVSKMLVIFPFEEEYYRRNGVDAEFVGHPLADLSFPEMTRREYANLHKLDPSKHWIGLLPGSRMKEIQLNLPVMTAAANLLGASYEFVLPAAATLDPQSLRAMVAENKDASRRGVVPVRVVEDARAALLHTRASIVASGTATVEAALIGNPFIAVYRLSQLSYAVARRLVNLPHVAMVNLIAGKRIVPELIQDEFTAEKVVATLHPLLEESTERCCMIKNLSCIRHALCRMAPSAALTPQSHPLNETAIDRVMVWVLRYADGDEPSHAAAPAPLHV